jgi:arsenate reductase
MKKRVLFICVHNSARSQMAEALLNHIDGEHFEAHSAGLDPGTLSPFVVEVMREIDIDISGSQTKSVFDMYKSGRMFAHVITVCDESSAERCPIFPGVSNPLHWSFTDPSSFGGTREERLEKTREVRDAISDCIQAWCAEMSGVAQISE